MQQLSRYGDFVGKMLEVSGWDGGASATDLAEQYLGALSLSPALEAIAPQLLYSAVRQLEPNPIPPRQLELIRKKGEYLMQGWIPDVGISDVGILMC